MSADLAALAAIHAAAFTTPRPWDAGEIAALLNSPGAFLLAEPGGFLMGRVIADEAELLTIAVSAEARKQGLGTSLVTTFISEARSRGAATAFLEVGADNHSARALYEKTGFIQTGRRPGYYTAPDGKRIDALILARALPPATEEF